MPRNKDRKRITRERMRKTGESYTTARLRVISKSRTTPDHERNVDHAALAGMTDDKVAAKTARTWRQWVDALDADGAAGMSHTQIAALVHRKYDVGDWWAQTVTVGYERIKGFRERGQRRDGSYEATKSRTFDVPVKALFAAWSDPATRRRWLDGIAFVVRTSTAPKSMRLHWPDGTLVAVGFTSKGPRKSAVALAHSKLRDSAASGRAKEYWTGRLDALATVFADSSK